MIVHRMLCDHCNQEIAADATGAITAGDASMLEVTVRGCTIGLGFHFCSVKCLAAARDAKLQVGGFVAAKEPFEAGDVLTADGSVLG